MYITLNFYDAKNNQIIAYFVSNLIIKHNVLKTGKTENYIDMKILDFKKRANKEYPTMENEFKSLDLHEIHLRVTKDPSNTISKRMTVIMKNLQKTSLREILLFSKGKRVDSRNNSFRKVILISIKNQ